MTAEVNREMLSNEKLFVEVYDENTTRGDVLIGNGYVDFRQFCINMHSFTPVSVDIKDEKGSISGNIAITAKLGEVEEGEMENALPSSAVKFKKVPTSPINFESIVVMMTALCQRLFSTILNMLKLLIVKRSC